MLRFYPEIEGKQTFQYKIILQTLNSKRLLIDHLEILEECLATIEPPQTHTFTTPKFLALTFAGAICTRFLFRHQSTSRWTLPILAFSTATYFTCYGVKQANRFHFRRQEESLARLIKSLDRFEAAIRRNLLFLNDAQHAGKGVASTTTKLAQQDCFAGNCVRVCMDVVRKIHGAVTGLERGHELDERWREVYAPMEDLEDCELFGEEVPEIKGAAGVRIIKDLYNIYAYVQSQFLTRLALTVACGMTDLTACRLTELSSEIDAFRDDCMKYIDRITESKKEAVPRPVAKSLPPANLRSLSTALSMKMLKTVHRYNQLEDLLQESTEHYGESAFIKQLSSLETSLEEISSELTASDDECQRILILVKKLANKEDPLPQLPQPPEQPEPTQTQPIYSEQYNPPQKDEFFAVDGSDPQQSDEDGRPPLNDLEAIDSKIVKRHFRPVLQQLRERIEPIGVEFREREKRALQDMGIQLEEEEQESVTKKSNLYGSSDEEEESEEENQVDRRKEKKFQRSVERYDEVRGFLAAKEQMSIFAMRPPPMAMMMGNGMEEEVLE